SARPRWRVRPGSEKSSRRLPPWLERPGPTPGTLFSIRRDRFPEGAVVTRGQLRIRQGQQAGDGLRQHARRVRIRTDARPWAVPVTVGIAGAGEAGPRADQLVRKMLLQAVQRVRDAVRPAVPAREQVLDIAGVIGKR